MEHKESASARSIIRWTSGSNLVTGSLIGISAATHKDAVPEPAEKPGPLLICTWRAGVELLTWKASGLSNLRRTKHHIRCQTASAAQASVNNRGNVGAADTGRWATYRAGRPIC
jgi:hypothetical protein